MKGSVYKRGNTYTYVVDLGRDHITNKRRQKSKGGFLRKKDADTALRKILVDLDEGKYIERSKEIFSTFLIRWFDEHYKTRIGETTSASRRYMIEKHLILENPFSSKPLSAISTEDIDALYNLKIDENYSASYIRKMHQMLNKAFEQARKWRRIEYNLKMQIHPQLKGKKYKFGHLSRYIDFWNIVQLKGLF